MKLIRNVVLALTLVFPGLAGAQEASAEQRLSVELNAADTVGESCRLSFFLRNLTEQDIDQFVVETVLFSKEGQVVLLTLFDFAEIPVGRPRVRQFQVPDTSCDSLGMVLVNGVDTCKMGGQDTGLCSSVLDVSHRTDIALEG